MPLIYVLPSDNVIDDATLTPSSETTGYEAENLRDGNPAKPWTTTSTNPSLFIDFSSAQAVNFLALIHHNLATSAVVRIKGSSTTSFGSATVDRLVTVPAWEADGYPVSPWIDLSTEANNSLRYWQLAVSTSGPNDVAVSIGELWMASTWRTLTARHLAVGLQQGYTRPIIEHQTDYGVRAIYDLGVKTKRMSGTVVGSTGTLDQLKGWWDDCHGRALPSVVVFTTDTNEALMMRWADITRVDTRQTRSVSSVAVAWDEVSRGLVL